MDSRLVSLCLAVLLGCGGGGPSTSAAPQSPKGDGGASEGGTSSGSESGSTGAQGGRSGTGSRPGGSGSGGGTTGSDRDASSPSGGGGSNPPANAGDGVNVFLSGHSLFNLVMPAMLDQIARQLGQSHNYNLQMGLGSSMATRLSGMGSEQDREGRRMSFDVRQEIANATTIGAGNKYDTLLVTEAVPIMTQLLFTDTVGNLGTFYGLLMQSDPNGVVYLFDSWPRVEGDFSAWIDTTRAQYVVWECIASKVSRDPARSGNPVRLAPAGIVMADLVEAVQNGTVPGISDATQLFQQEPTLIHASNLGNYYIALVMYSTLYGRSPVGAPRTFDTPQGAITNLVSEATATALAELAWNNVSAFQARGAHNDRSMSECRAAVRNFCTNMDCGNRVDTTFAD